MSHQRYRTVRKCEVDGNQFQAIADDFVAVEEPVEIVLEYASQGTWVRKSISMTMRTPGDDVDLAVGFLFTEQIIQSFADIVSVEEQCQGASKVKVRLNESIEVSAEKLERNFFTNSSCGVCGKRSAASLDFGCSVQATSKTWAVTPDLIHQLPTRLRITQSAFEITGGIHGAAFFDKSGKLLMHREDVGRHNALDKLIGKYLQTQGGFAENCLLMLSSRISFELVQKSVVLGIPLVVAVGAPSTLAIELADQYGMTLLGFVKNDRFNIYTHPERIAAS